MDNLIRQLSESSTTVQALGVTVGGLAGVFATLGIFFVIIWVSDKLGKRGS